MISSYTQICITSIRKEEGETGQAKACPSDLSAKVLTTAEVLTKAGKHGKITQTKTLASAGVFVALFCERCTISIYGRTANAI